MSRIVFMNDRLMPEDEARVSVFDHGLLYGDGVFEGLRSYAGRVFRLEAHIDRLWESARAICLEIPLSKAAVADAVNQTLAANQLADGYVRLVVTRGAGSLGLDPTRTKNPQVIVIADTISLYPREYYEKGLRIVTAATQRTQSAALSPRIKSLNYLNNIMAKLEGLEAGCVEALMLNHKGEVAECTGDNIFIVRGGALLTPPRDAGILEGITRNAVLELAVQAGMIAVEATLVRHDLYTADECFLTGTAAEVIPVVTIDGRCIGSGTPGPITMRLSKDFHTLVRA
ncbi:MAG: branched-chain-amino-acid transaminase [Planctomycetota bacterium]|nr:MAG: branched-chain-amino-acid transaminase [Planctomycetota bacterium]